MSYISDTLSNLVNQTAFFNLSVGNYVMIVVACIFLYLAIKKEWRTSSAGANCLRYALGKYLSRYYFVSGRIIRGSCGTSAFLLSVG